MLAIIKNLTYFLQISGFPIDSLAEQAIINLTIKLHRQLRLGEQMMTTTTINSFGVDIKVIEQPLMTRKNHTKLRVKYGLESPSGAYSGHFETNKKLTEAERADLLNETFATIRGDYN